MAMARRALPRSLAAVVAAAAAAAAYLSLAPGASVGAVAAAASAERSDAEAAYRRALADRTSPSSSPSLLASKAAELSALREGIDSKLDAVRKRRDELEYDLEGRGGTYGGGRDEGAGVRGSDVLSAAFDDMDAIEAKVAELVRRTEAIAARTKDFNGRKAEGWEARLDAVRGEEVARRERYDAAVKSIDAANADAADASNATTDEEGDIPEVSAAPAPEVRYAARDDLAALLSPSNVADPSESTLVASLSALVGSVARGKLDEEETARSGRAEGASERYRTEFAALEKEKGGGGGGCLSVPRAAEMVGRALEEHHNDGTDLIDHASYENGGTVVYELTSGPYVPPPRNDDAPSERAAYELGKQRAFDRQTREMYDARKMHDMRKMPSSSEGIDWWEWYARFEFGSMRPYLPDDWERLLDRASERWGEYTPRGALDALVPDYVYHALGLSSLPGYGRAFGRTAAPEVAISGYGTPAPLGRCYPLSARDEDDPAPELLARRASARGDDGAEGEDERSSLLAGPKYTVRLPYPVAIDAVSIEHRSFPISRGELERGMKGGESAPRWVRVVGFPPCAGDDGEEEDDDDDDVEEGEEECRARGFDVDRPVDLGTFEYRRITVTGREDDYGADGEEEDEVEDARGGRRRSVQTFAVRGGTWTPSSLLGGAKPPEDGSTDEAEDVADPARRGEEEEEEAEEPPALAAGQCAPPADEDSEPSCGGDPTSSSSSPSSGAGDEGGGERRRVVGAVSFVVEETWGDPGYACLYRVRVHGDPVRGG
ncbi:hypothetical protein ACHAWF_005078 [Thalassiosira exigua]